MPLYFLWVQASLPLNRVVIEPAVSLQGFIEIAGHYYDGDTLSLLGFYQGKRVPSKLINSPE